MIYQISLQNRMECKTVFPSSQCIAGSWSQLRIFFEVRATLWCYLSGFDFKMFGANGFYCKNLDMYAISTKTRSQSRYSSLCLLDIAAIPFWFSQQFRGLIVSWRFNILHSCLQVTYNFPATRQLQGEQLRQVCFTADVDISWYKLCMVGHRHLSGSESHKPIAWTCRVCRRAHDGSLRWDMLESWSHSDLFWDQHGCLWPFHVCFICFKLLIKVCLRICLRLCFFPDSRSWIETWSSQIGFIRGVAVADHWRGLRRECGAMRVIYSYIRSTVAGKM